MKPPAESKRTDEPDLKSDNLRMADPEAVKALVKNVVRALTIPDTLRVR